LSNSLVIVLIGREIIAPSRKEAKFGYWFSSFGAASSRGYSVFASLLYRVGFRGDFLLSGGQT
jgi:hypothetical protein